MIVTGGLNIPKGLFPTLFFFCSFSSPLHLFYWEPVSPRYGVYVLPQWTLSVLLYCKDNKASNRKPSLQHRDDLCEEPCSKRTLGPLPKCWLLDSALFWFGEGSIPRLFCLYSFYWGGCWSLLLIPSPMQINREHRNINKTKLDTASLRFPPLRGPCGSWAPAVKGGDCATTVISYPMANAEFLRLGMAIAESLAEEQHLLWSF